MPDPLPGPAQPRQRLGAPGARVDADMADGKPSLFAHANTLARGGHWADAGKVYDHLLRLHPDAPMYRRGLAQALRALGRAAGPGRTPVVSLPAHVPLPALALRTLEALLRHGLLGLEALRAMEPQLGSRSDFALLPLVVSLPEDLRWLQAFNGWLDTARGLAVAPATRCWLAAADDRPGGDAAQPQGPPAVAGPELRLRSPGGRWGRLRLQCPAVGVAAACAGEPAGQVRQSPVVTVAMACHDNADTLEAAARSVLGQTLRELELVIVDDASTDASATVAARLAALDSRVRFLRNPRNLGTYASRNLALATSHAPYFCTLDADDIALPGRLASQLSMLQARPQAVAVVSRWVRMTAEGRPVAMNIDEGGFAHRSVATLMMRREAALQHVGYWDEVRFEADSEYMNRLVAVLGPQALLWDSTVVALALHRAGSLTQDAATGLDDIFGPSVTRLQYRQAWQAWHQSGRPLYLAQGQHPRPFAAPAAMVS